MSHNKRIRFVAGAANKVYGQARQANTQYANTTDTTAIEAKVKRQGTAEPTFDGELTPVSDYLTDHMQTSDPGYSCDTNDARTVRGFNFSWLIPASALPSEGWYTVEVKFTDANGATRLLWSGPAYGTIDAGAGN
ncbi:MAG: hypothetical protein FJ276_09050 [Planctomycetes bacterium]|nr:hypothetical protein [Planctomycetota bacterium]